MPWLHLGVSLLLSAGAGGLSLACFHLCVLAPKWRRSQQALGRAEDEWYDYDDVVPKLKVADVAAGGNLRLADRRKSFA